MNLFKVKELIKNTELYRQATDSRAFYLWTPAMAVAHEFGFPCFCPFVEERFEGYYPKKKIVQQAKEFLEKTKKDRKVILGYSNKLDDVYKKFDKIFSRLDKEDFDNMEKDKLLKLLKEFDDLTFDYWYIGWLCDKFDPEGHEMLKAEMEKAGVELTDEEIEQLTQPAELNFMDYSELDLYKLARECRGKGISDEELLKKLKNYAKKYFYVQNSWMVVKVLKENDYLEPLKEIMQEPMQEIEKRIKEIENKTQNMIKKSEEIAKEKRFSQELGNVFYLYRRLAEIRDIRKDYVLKSNHHYWLFIEGLSRIYCVDVELVSRALPREFLDIDDMNKFKETLKRRKTAILVVDNSGFFVLDGKDAEECIHLLHKLMLDKYSEIKGFCASRGKVEGVVKIIRGHAHFSKFEKGDIIVAPMTRPEYVPLMKKAKAIITDEGGMTSHAAVVSRELCIPCVVGTQIATHKLADGDLVEVDANNGVVRLLK